MCILGRKKFDHTTINAELPQIMRIFPRAQCTFKN